MTKAIVKKLLSIILTLFFVSVLIFLVFQIIPGNPAEIILGTEADPAQIKALERELGLDKSMFQRYITWIGGLLRLDMGESLKYRMPVSTLFLRKLPVPLTLTLYSLILSILIIMVLILVFSFQLYSFSLNHSLFYVVLYVKYILHFLTQIILQYNLKKSK